MLFYNFFTLFHLISNKFSLFIRINILINIWLIVCYDHVIIIIIWFPFNYYIGSPRSLFRSCFNHLRLFNCRRSSICWCWSYLSLCRLLKLSRRRLLNLWLFFRFFLRLLYRLWRWLLLNSLWRFLNLLGRGFLFLWRLSLILLRLLLSLGGWLSRLFGWSLFDFFFFWSTTT